MVSKKNAPKILPIPTTWGHFFGTPCTHWFNLRYFGGDIKIASCDGYGTDAYIYLKALETDAKETLPIFNASSSSKIKDTKNQVEDWTKDE